MSKHKAILQKNLKYCVTENIYLRIFHAAAKEGEERIPAGEIMMILCRKNINI